MCSFQKAGLSEISTKGLRLHICKCNLIQLSVINFGFNVQGNPDDEEDIFTKDVRELQSRIKDNKEVTENSSTTVQSELEASTSASTNNNNNDAAVEAKKNWVTFPEEPTTVQYTLHESFAQDFNNDLERIHKFENNFVDVPQPLFNDIQVNNNTTYSYEPVGVNGIDTHQPTVFMTEPPSRRNSLLQTMEYLKQPRFYMSLVTIVTTKFSQFVYFTLFPSYLYLKVDKLKVHHTTTLVGCIAVTGLCFTITSVWVNTHTTKRPVLLWLLCWFGSCGYLSKFVLCL